MVDVVVGQAAVGFGDREDLAPGLLEAEDGEASTRGRWRQRSSSAARPRRADRMAVSSATGWHAGPQVNCAVAEPCWAGSAEEAVHHEHVHGVGPDAVGTRDD